MTVTCQTQIIPPLYFEVVLKWGADSLSLFFITLGQDRIGYNGYCFCYLKFFKANQNTKIKTWLS